MFFCATNSCDRNAYPGVHTHSFQVLFLVSNRKNSCACLSPLGHLGKHAGRYKRAQLMFRLGIWPRIAIIHSHFVPWRIKGGSISASVYTMLSEICLQLQKTVRLRHASAKHRLQCQILCGEHVDAPKDILRARHNPREITKNIIENTCDSPLRFEPRFPAIGPLIELVICLPPKLSACCSR